MNAGVERIRVDGVRIRCKCGAFMPEGKAGGWGSWCCPNCRRPWCQDCGAPIDENTGNCEAYELDKADQASLL